MMFTKEGEKTIAILSVTELSRVIKECIHEGKRFKVTYRCGEWEPKETVPEPIFVNNIFTINERLNLLHSKIIELERKTQNIT